MDADELLSPEAFPVPLDHQIELQRRLVDAEQNPDDESPWEEVRAEVLGDLQTDDPLDQNAELQRRLDEEDLNPPKGIAWEELKARLLSEA